jgi:hypothetical protein
MALFDAIHNGFTNSVPISTQTARIGVSTGRMGGETGSARVWREGQQVHGGGKKMKEILFRVRTLWGKLWKNMEYDWINMQQCSEKAIFHIPYYYSIPSRKLTLPMTPRYVRHTIITLSSPVVSAV